MKNTLSYSWTKCYKVYIT